MGMFELWANYGKSMSAPAMYGKTMSIYSKTTLIYGKTMAIYSKNNNEYIVII